MCLFRIGADMASHEGRIIDGSCRHKASRYNGRTRNDNAVPILPLCLSWLGHDLRASPAREPIYPIGEVDRNRLTLQRCLSRTVRSPERLSGRRLLLRRLQTSQISPAWGRQHAQPTGDSVIAHDRMRPARRTISGGCRSQLVRRARRAESSSRYSPDSASGRSDGNWAKLPSTSCQTRPIAMPNTP